MSYTVPSKASLSQLTASSHVSASSFYGDGSNLTNIAAGGLTSVVTNGNITGSGTSGNPVGIKPDPLFNTVTASYFVGDGSKLTNISASAITNVNYLDFNTGINPAFNVGRLHYGTDSGDLEFDLANDNTTLNIGQQLIVKVKNNISPATTLQKGKVVKVSGSQGSSDVLYVITASWENDPGSANTIGLLMTELTGGEIGYVILEGVLQGVNTSAYTAGQMLYLSSSGNMTSSAPTPPNHSVRIGHVARVHENNGSIFVRVQNGYEIDELHDVLITNPQSYDLIIRDADGLWKNTKNLSGSYIISGSFANGTDLYINNNYSHAEGCISKAYGYASHAEGHQCETYYTSSHAEGYKNIANAPYSHVEGVNLQAIGTGSHAEGSGSYTNGNFSHAEGQQTLAYGYASHAEGQLCEALGNYSHAEGLYTIATSSYQHVQGRYNATRSAALMIIGNGSISNRSNILEVYPSSLIVSGSMYLTNLLSQATSSKTSSSSGSVGQICWDENYIYVCTANNTWKSSSLN